MITGDKQETAINIAVSCRLVRNPDALLRCNAPGSKAAAEARLRELLAAAPDAASGKGGGGGCGDGGGRKPKVRPRLEPRARRLRLVFVRGDSVVMVGEARAGEDG